MSTLFVIGGESMGSGDAGLGKKILGTFFHTLATLDPKPEAIVFYNAGVRLLAPSSPHLDALRALDDQGIELLACVTCLEFFGLVGEIAAGRVTNMREIVQQMLGAGKVVTL